MRAKPLKCGDCGGTRVVALFTSIACDDCNPPRASKRTSTPGPPRCPNHTGACICVTDDATLRYRYDHNLCMVCGRKTANIWWCTYSDGYTDLCDPYVMSDYAVSKRLKTIGDGDRNP